MNKNSAKHAGAILLLIVCSLLTLVSAEDVFAPQSSPPLSDFPSLISVSLVPSSSMAPSAPTVVAPPTRTFPPAMIPPQPIPTEAPTALPVAAATAPPTGQLVDTEGNVYITLFYVPDVVPEQYVEAYERQCAAFFSERLSTLTDPISGITCSLLEQEIVPNETRLRRRSLQADMTRLLTLMNVKGKISEAVGSPSDINLILRFAVLNDPDGFAKALREETGTGFYFEKVETVDAFDPESFTPYPTVSPPVGQAEDDSDLEVVGIVAIIIGIVASAIIASAVTFLVMKKGQSNTVGAASPTREKKDDSESENVQAQAVPEAVVESVPPPVKENPSATTVDDTPVVEDDIHVIPVAPVTNDDIHEDDDIPETEDDEFPVTASTSVMESEGADALSYAYSLDAGNVDSHTGERVGESTLGGDLSTEVSVRPNMTSREVIAPPGKLGIVIDTTLEGPVVHKVNPGSPLEDKVYPGDIIVAIDDVDTRAMSASAITALMVKTANQERRLTVLSEEGMVSSEP